MPSRGEIVFELGTAKLNLLTGEIEVDGASCFLGRRALEIVRVLHDAEGALVTKENLLTAVWGTEAVDVNVLQAQISSIRRALARNRTHLETVPGRGYRLRPSLKRLSQAVGAQTEEKALLPSPSMAQVAPIVVGTRLVGRDGTIAQLLPIARAQVLVSLVGLEGIGKSRLALALVRLLQDEFSGGVGIADVAAIDEEGLIAPIVAHAFGLQPAVGINPTELLVRALSALPRILVLDNCQHVKAPVARFIESLCRVCPNLHVIATTREPLEMQGEYIFKVPPLSIPASGEPVSDPHLFGAVQLFEDRLSPAEQGTPRDSGWFDAAGDIVRGVQGIPLAVEIVAARARRLGLDRVRSEVIAAMRASLDDSARESPSLATLSASTRWSIDFLSEVEASVLDRLSSFPSSFSLDEAVSAVAWGGLGTLEIENAINSLTEASLVTLEPGIGKPRFRLKDPIRGIARTRLGESGQLEEADHRFAASVLRTCQLLGAQEARTSDPHSSIFANIRAALKWAYLTSIHRFLAVELTAAAVAVWFAEGFMEECRNWVMRAFEIAGGPDDFPPRIRLQLHSALGSVLQYTAGWTPALEENWASALELAKILDDYRAMRQACWGLWLANTGAGRHSIAAGFARRLIAIELAHSDKTDFRIGNRLLGTSFHFLGQQDEAWPLLYQMLQQQATPGFSTVAALTRFDYDQMVAANPIAARVKWLQGHAQEGMWFAAEGVARCDKLAHPVSLCHALASGAVPISIWVGDTKSAQLYLTRLTEVTNECGLHVWGALARGWKGVLGAKLGFVEEGAATLELAIRDAGKANFGLYQLAFRSAYAEALIKLGRFADAEKTIEDGVRDTVERDDRWYVPEFLRVRAAYVRTVNPARIEEAETLLLSAYTLAKSGGATTWQLRIALDLARLRIQTSRALEGRALLADIYNKFDMAFLTDDLVAAGEFLKSFVVPPT